MAFEWLKRTGRAISQTVKSWVNDGDFATASAMIRGSLLERDSVVHPFEENSAAYAAIRVLAENTAKPPLQIHRGPPGKSVAMDSHPMLEIMSRPNEHDDYYSYTERISQMLDCTGAGITVMPGRKLNQLPTMGMHPQPSEGFYPITSSRAATWGYIDPIGLALGSDRLLGWEQRGMRSRKIWSVEETMILRYPHPRIPMAWLSPLEAAAIDIDADKMAALYNRNFQKNGAHPSGVLTLTGAVSDEEWDSLKARFKDKFQNVLNSHEPMLLHGGMTWTPSAVTHKESEFLGQREFSTERVLMVLGVPAECAGLGKKTFENVDAAWKNLWVHKLDPRLTRIESLLNHTFRHALGPQERFVFDRSDISYLQEDLTEKLTQGLMLYQLGYPPNMVNERLKLDMPKLEWGDDPPMGFGGQIDDGLDPFEDEEEGEPEDVPELQDEEEAEEVEEDEEEKALPVRRVLLSLPGKTAPQVQREYVPGDITTCTMGLNDVQRAATRNLDKRAGQLERQMRDRLRAHFFRMRNVVLAKIKKHAAEIDANAKALPGTVCKISASTLLFGMADAKADLKSAIKSVSLMAITEGAKSAIREIGGSVAAWKIPRRVLNVHSQRLNKIAIVDKHVGEKVRDKIGELLKDQATIAEIQAAVKERFDVARRGALRIARTEVQGSVNEARHEQFQEEEIEEHEWLNAVNSNASGGTVRDSHKIHGQVRKIGTQFSNGLRYPGDQNGPAKEVVNCRCRTVAIIPDDEDD